MRLIFAAILAAFALLGCITPKEKKDLQNDLFNVQTRLLTLERQLTDTSKDAKSTGEVAHKKLASTEDRMDKILRELQGIKGDLDAMRVGVVTGQMPGQDNVEGSIASTLGKLAERLDSVEQSQEELIDALKKAGLNKAKKQAKKLDSVSGLQQAFDDKHYKQVIDDAPKVIATAAGSEKEEARFLLAESQFKLGKMREAALKFNEFLESKPSNKYVPLAKMRIGDCFRNLGDVATAKVYYEELIKEFPNSEEASKAKERLSDSGKGGSDTAEKG